MARILFLLTSLLLGINSYAQIEINRPIEAYGFNKNTIVLNKSGARYPYGVWSKLVATGQYRLKPIHHDSDSTKFILTKRDTKKEEVSFASAAKPEETRFFTNGTPFKFFELTDVNGYKITPADLVGKTVVLNFWFIACPPCRYEMPELNRLVQAYQNDKNVVFIAISLDSEPNVKRFLKVSPFDYHVVANAMSLFSNYRVDQCPASLVVDGRGIIRFNSQGYGNGSVPYWIGQTIEALKLDQ